MTIRSSAVYYAKSALRLYMTHGIRSPYLELVDPVEGLWSFTHTDYTSERAMTRAAKGQPYETYTVILRSHGAVDAAATKQANIRI